MNRININKRERNIFLDTVKGFAIMLVVLGHCIQYGRGEDYLQSGSFFNEIPYKIIYSFHMPLFMLISGYFFFFSTNKAVSFKVAFLSRLSKLLIPIIAWNILTYFFLKIFGFTIIGPKNFILNALYFLYTNLWFLWAVFWSSLAILIVKNYCNDSIYMYILFFLLSFFTPDGYGLSLYKFMYTFFVIGYLYNKHQIFINSKIFLLKSSYLLCLTGIFYLILIPFYDYNSYIYNGGITIIGSYSKGYMMEGGQIWNQITLDFYRYFIGVIGSLFVLLAINAFYKQKQFKNVSLFAKMGIESLGIYIISSLIFPFLAKLTFGISLNYFVTIVETIGLLLISYILILPFKKYRLSNTIFFGGR